MKTHARGFHGTDTDTWDQSSEAGSSRIELGNSRPVAVRLRRVVACGDS